MPSPARTFVLEHSGSQLTPFAERQRVAVGGEHLNANVVGAGRVMLANTVSDCIEITPSDHRVDQPVTAAIPEIVFVESKPQKVVSVVRQLEVELQELASDFSRFRRISFEHDRLLRTQVLTCTKNLASPRRMFRSHIVGESSIGSFRSKFQHLRS